MPRKAAQILETEIAKLLASQRVCAKGMWFVMREIFEHPDNKRPGFLCREWTVIGPDELSHLAGASGNMMGNLLGKLMDVGLVEKDGAGTYHSPRITRIYEARQATLQRVIRHRALRNAQKGVTKRACNAPVTRAPPPPPPLSLSPTPPISIPTTPSPSFGVCADDSDHVGMLEGWEMAGIPLPLQTPVFKRAFAEWILAARQRGEKPAAISIRAALAHCSAWGHDRAVENLNYSIRNNYKGLCEVKNGSHKQSSHRATAAERGHFPEPKGELPDLLARGSGKNS